MVIKLDIKFQSSKLVPLAHREIVFLMVEINLH